jgi:phosphoribosylformimino-5-aminoimidazole carboxamide ribotide isomerase
MQIIPVLDLKGGIAVQAFRGERDKYGPLASVLCESSDPVDLSKNFERRLGSSVIYIADLDGIQRQERDWAVIKEIQSQTNLRLYLDTGIRTKKDLLYVANQGIEYCIIATETLTDYQELLEGIEELKPNQKVVISLDIWQGQIMAKDPAIATMSLKSILSTFDHKQVAGFIVLELTQIGTQEGVSTSPVREVLNHTSKWVITGGGIKDVGGLLELKSLGVHGVLVGTALHNGNITREMIERVQSA